MPLTLTVVLIVLATIVVVGALGTLIDNTQETVEHADQEVSARGSRRRSDYV